MIKKLQSYFPTSITTDNPYSFSLEKYYWFKENEPALEWIGIPKPDLNEDQLHLLSTLFELLEPDQSSYLGASAKEWSSFLFKNGEAPVMSSPIRFIQLHIENADEFSSDTEAAIRDFFHGTRAFFWLDKTHAIIVEEKSEVFFEESEFQSISTTLENDFYFRPFFYIGKFRSTHENLRDFFFREQEVFREAKKYLYQDRVISFEKALPTLIATKIPEGVKSLLENDIGSTLKEDTDLLRTLEVYLESNSNVSLAAKNLYIHRNTLQYRLDKFSESTGINLKSFDHAFTVYLACKLSGAGD